MLVGVSNGTLGATVWDFTILLVSSIIPAVSVPCTSHELYHRRNRFFKILGLIGHMKFFSGHIPIYHNEQHHKYTGIRGKDPGFPPRGTTAFDIVEFLGFWGFMETYRFEDSKLKKRGVTGSMDRLLANRVVRYRVIEIIYLIALYFTLGWKALLFQLLFAQISLTILSTTNLFVYKPYQILDTVENSPTLPFGYSAAFLCAWCPPIWRKIMDPMLDAIDRGEKMSEQEVKKQKRVLDLYLTSVWIILTFVQFFIIGINIPSF
ncbi:hypothetical protein FGO68_gene9103 [Halteria grandinella]|uniref:Fatty acid desaturase domain-containing protein n=1 Tax=Halteria grandinella TaxID=5974 RepID=A0A8J8T2B5_HALGN|nr:hypothetical protein FGO68_gene9103 [Halteria grandinella]